MLKLHKAALFRGAFGVVLGATWCGTAVSADESAATLPAVEVRDRPDAHEAQSAFGTLDENPFTRPITIQGVDQREFESHGGRRLTDLQDFIPGVFSGSGDSEDRSEDSLSIRGFDNYYPLVNGIRHLRVSPGAMSLANVERIEVIKGAAGVEAGTIEPGGAINVITKKPRWQAARQFGVEVDSYDRVGLDADLTGPLNDQWAYRLIASGAQGDGFRDQPRDEALIAPSLAWQPTPTQQWLLETAAAYTDYGYDTGGYYIQEAGLDDDFATRRFSYQEDGGHNRQRDARAALYGRWQLDAATELRLSSSFEHRDTHATGLIPFGDTLYQNGASNTLLYSGDPIIDRSPFVRDNPDQRGLASQLMLVRSFNMGATTHRVAVAAQSSRDRFDQRLSFGETFVAQNVLDPSQRFEPSDQPVDRGANAPIPDFDDEPLGPVDTSFGVRVRQESVQTQYVGDWQRWHWLAGVRRDKTRYRVNFLDSRDPEPFGEAFGSGTNAYRLGVSVKLAEPWVLYATGGSAYLPQGGVTVEGRALRPSRATNHEVGVRYAQPDGTSFEFNVFQVEVDRFAQFDPSAGGFGFFQIDSGTLESRGVEWTLDKELPKQRHVSLFGTYLDARITGSTEGFDGRRQANAPYWSGGVRVFQGLEFIGLPDTGIELAALYVGERRAGLFYQYDRNYLQPDYTRLDLNIEHRLGPRVDLNLYIQNLLDHEYIAAAGTNPWVNFPGESISATLQLRIRY